MTHPPVPVLFAPHARFDVILILKLCFRVCYLGIMYGSDDDATAQNEASHELMEATCALYGLIHARYVLTTAGLEAMYAKYTLQVQCSARCG